MIDEYGPETGGDGAYDGFVSIAIKVVTGTCDDIAGPTTRVDVDSGAGARRAWSGHGALCTLAGVSLWR